MDLQGPTFNFSGKEGGSKAEEKERQRAHKEHTPEIKLLTK